MYDTYYRKEQHIIIDFNDEILRYTPLSKCTNFPGFYTFFFCLPSYQNSLVLNYPILLKLIDLIFINIMISYLFLKKLKKVSS